VIAPAATIGAVTTLIAINLTTAWTQHAAEASEGQEGQTAPKRPQERPAERLAA